MYRGRYCVGCEQFYIETELADGLCPEHLTQPEWVEEENYFFRLSHYQQPLLELIESGRLRIVPSTRRNEVLSFIRAGLADFSISRSRKRARGWGITVPDDPEQVIYVWFDALGNYIAALDYANTGPLYQRYWVDNPNRIHVIGKGIIRFHAVYWPALLLSAGLPLPSAVFVHGYVTANGHKISKSLGNTIDPVKLAEQYGSDALRYYLLRHIRSTEDGDFNLERFTRAYQAELADQLGNLLSRTSGLIERYCDDVVPAPDTVLAADQVLREIASAVPSKIATAIEQFQLHEAITAIWELIAAANKYVNDTAPWRLAKSQILEDQARLRTVLYHLVETLRLSAYFLEPFLPLAAASITAQLGLSSNVSERWGSYPVGTQLPARVTLFPKNIEQL